MNQKPKIAVLGMWHLGCVISASWLKLGFEVISIDRSLHLVEQLSQGTPPIYEPEMEEIFKKALLEKKWTVSTDLSFLKDCDVIFLAYDTPVNEQDDCDLEPLESVCCNASAHLSADALLIVSSQVPVGTCSRWQNMYFPSIAYSPENLKLGEAIENYLHPGHLILGGDPHLIKRALELFSCIRATYITMDTESAEMTKHAINSFLATSITFANQLADACASVGANIQTVTSSMKQDPRIGAKAYLQAGLGFSGGTLGRDLRILKNQSFFQEIWQHNRQRPLQILHKLARKLGGFSQKTCAVLGITYKPGTSTLRRSIPLEIAQDMIRKGAKVKVYDPKANWSEIDPIKEIHVAEDPYQAATGADCLCIFTQWPEFQQLDMDLLGKLMNHRILFDPYYHVQKRYEELYTLNFQIFNNLGS
ncbi:MAG: nucleotide sugar dehydrogenase [Chlamydiales bacterium]|nr:nucleotide sugar dehydrogenase [Chlamydiales bacterium]